MHDNTPIYEVLFDIQMSLCERFPALTPFALRREKAREVFILIARLNVHTTKENAKTGNTPTQQQVIRKPAGDNWF